MTRKIGMCCACGNQYSTSKTRIVGGEEYGPCCLPMVDPDGDHEMEDEDDED